MASVFPASIPTPLIISTVDKINHHADRSAKITPAVINKPTITRLHVIFSKPKINADMSTQIGLDDLTIVKNVIDILTKDRFDNTISKAVTNPTGIETPSMVV